MKKIGFYSLVCLFLIGCGGGGTTTPDDSVTPPILQDDVNTILAKDLNLTKDINDDELVIDSNALIKDQYLTVINYLRSLKIKCNDSHGKKGPVSSIEWNQLLADASQEHSDDMNTSGVYSHDGSGTVLDITGSIGSPSTPAERVAATGYVGQAGENIAAHIRAYKNAEGKPTNFEPVDSDTWILIIEKWMISKKGHCSNLMNPDNKSFGMHETGTRIDDNGTHTLYSTYWTQEFGNQ